MKFYVVSLSVYSFIATALIILLAIQNHQLKQPPSGVAEIDYQDVKVVNLEGGHARGSNNPVVTVIEFTDYECPYCSLSSKNMSRLLKEYPDQLRVVTKNFPLRSHPNAVAAAKAALAAGTQGHFWPMHEALFQNPGRLTHDFFLTQAEELGLDVDQFLADLEAPDIKAQIEADIAEAEAIGVRGTPGILVNGVLLPNPSFGKVKEAVNHF